MKSVLDKIVNSIYHRFMTYADNGYSQPRSEQVSITKDEHLFIQSTPLSDLNKMISDAFYKEGSLAIPDFGNSVYEEDECDCDRSDNKKMWYKITFMNPKVWSKAELDKELDND